MKEKQTIEPSQEVKQKLLSLNKRKEHLVFEAELNKELEKFPNSSFLHNLMGICLGSQNRLEESLNYFNLALKNSEHQSLIFNNKGITEIKLNRIDEAINSLNQAIEINPLYAEAHLNLGNALKKSGELEGALISYDMAIKHNNKLHNAYLYKSLTLKSLGKFKNSEEVCRQTLKIRPKLGIAHRHLSSMLKYKSINDPHLKEMKKLLESKALSKEDRIQLSFGLAKAYEDVKSYKDSFRYLKEGNSLFRKTIDYSTEKRTNFFTALKQNFDAGFTDPIKNISNQGEEIIFVLGMPRSGTSLVEQILSSHSEVYGAGELRHLKEATDKALYPINKISFPRNVRLHDAKSFKNLGNYYLELVSKEKKVDSEKVVDKMPYNFIHVGLIHKCLPQAKILLCERNPLDNCFSIYKQKFGIGNDYAYSLEEIGEYYNLYADLIKHWESVLPNKMYRVSYENMIANQEEVSKEMINFCKLNWEDSCLTFHKNEREVNTASSVQVRQPIYNTSVNLWKNYDKELDSLSKILTNK